MRKRMEILLGAAAVLTLCMGCGRLDDVEVTSVYADGRGAVTEAIVEAYSEADGYKEKELKSFVKADVKSFNEERGEDSVSLKSCKISGDTVRIVLEYEDDDAYADYHKTEFFAGTVEEARDAGYDFAAEFADVEGNPVSLSEVLEGMKKPRVVIFQEPVQVVTDSVIVCASSNVKITGEKTADAHEESGGSELTEKIVLDFPAYIIYGK